VGEKFGECFRAVRALKRNVLDRRRWATRVEQRIAIVTWIERTYHRRRRQAALGRLSYYEYETNPLTPAGRRHPPCV
jgi:transposase InsO family protein